MSRQRSTVNPFEDHRQLYICTKKKQSLPRENNHGNIGIMINKAPCYLRALITDKPMDLDTKTFSTEAKSLGNTRLCIKYLVNGKVQFPADGQGGSPILQDRDSCLRCSSVACAPLAVSPCSFHPSAARNGLSRRFSCAKIQRQTTGVFVGPLDTPSLAFLH
jgi:hypothetical protein